jgi:hypothetical protein
MANSTVYSALFGSGGRTTRYGEFTMVFMTGCSFITTPMEFTQVGNWARSRVSSGNPNRDRTTFVERFETILGRMGSGISSKGSKASLLRIVKSMKANAVFMEEWNVPRDLDAGVEMKKAPVVDPLAKKKPGGTHS